jgi:hypothetical protein
MPEGGEITRLKNNDFIVKIVHPIDTGPAAVMQGTWAGSIGVGART